MGGGKWSVHGYILKEVQRGAMDKLYEGRERNGGFKDDFKVWKTSPISGRRTTFIMRYLESGRFKRKIFLKSWFGDLWQVPRTNDLVVRKLTTHCSP